MAKNYLSLEQAAAMLSLRPDELVRLREKGEIRGFADRGTWKFQEEDVQALVRKRQVDSDPEMPLYLGDDGADDDFQATSLFSDKENLGDDEFSTSDSDVKLVGSDMSENDLDLVLGGDSDVKLVGLDSESEVRLEAPSRTEPEFSLIDSAGDIDITSDSDSDVKLVGADSDSDIQLIGAGDADSDSDVKLVSGLDTASDMNLSPESSFALEGAADNAESPYESGALVHGLGADSQFDSDINLAGDDSDSDVSLLPGDDDAIALDPLGDDGDHASVLSDESGISLGGGSSILLPGESGISLEGVSGSGMHLGADDDEGITLALDDDSGISLSSGDSGISLEAADSGISLDTIADSGISLDDDFSGTIPMMDVMRDDDVAETQFEIPSLDEDSAYELSLDDDDLADTRTLELSEMSDEASLDDAVFEMDEEEEAGNYVSDAFADEDELDAGAFEDEDEFVEVDGDVFDTVENGPAFGPAVRASGPVESEWGMMEFGLLTVASLFMITCGIVLTDLVANTSTAANPNPISSAILDTLGGLYKS